MPLIDPAYFEFRFLCHMAGLTGVLLYVTSFFCLSTGRMDSSGLVYFILVLVAASLVLLSLCADFNLSAALIQGFYISMSLGAIALRMRAWRRTTRALKASPDHAVSTF